MSSDGQKGSKLEGVITSAQLVGSVGLKTEEEVFRAVGTQVGARTKRIPDGETGFRENFTSFLLDIYAQHGALVPAEQLHFGDRETQVYPTFKLRPKEERPAELRFEKFGYADAAVDSFRTFSALQESGIIPEDVRFLVCLPTPLNAMGAIVAEDLTSVEPAVEETLRRELVELLEQIPHDRVAIQWDASDEFGFLEELRPLPFVDVFGEIIKRLQRVASWVPDDVEVGFHLCYGSYMDEHFVEPETTDLMVKVANGTVAGMSRPVSWIHLPVPIDRVDDEYFAPLRELASNPKIEEVYLGLIHREDGVSGALARAEVASRYLPQFGVGCECGIGRVPADSVQGLIRLHAEVVDEAGGSSA
jgi:hypothetical protein